MSKTIHVDKVKEFCNRLTISQNTPGDKNWYIQPGQYNNPEFRRGVATVLEFILHETGNYHGFNYAHWAIDGGCEDWRAAGCPEDERKAGFIGDESRVFFY